MSAVAAPAGAGAATPATRPAAGPSPLDMGPLDTAAQAVYAAVPALANDWSCRPRADHPDPVVLLHGTLEPAVVAWRTLVPRLRADGYCTFAPSYGDVASGPLEQSAAQIAAFVDRVRAATGAARVDIVGHSIGGVLPRYYVRFLGGAPKVGRLVALAPINHGSTVDGEVLGPICPGCAQEFDPRSPFMTRLNQGGDTVPGISYTVISSRDDEMVTPFRSQGLSGPPDRVTDVVLQDRCPADTSNHSTILDDPVAAQWVLEALRSPGPADPAFVPVC
ncbi:esterase/lipase family protein [Speluncibacter jeojiensis]|uniref:Lipase family protein n=1 Tax=Speluncibacter jeojiensis TaxID=2710754 RepID=A0A9X4M5H6_9ACTN|nr:lipase family protein [Corynebacteriales bacterium D3-21]